MRRIASVSGIAGLLVLSLLVTPGRAANARPDGIVDLRDAVPSVLLDIRYHGPHNFVGAPVDGYRAATCLLTREAAEALGRVQAELTQFSLSLKVYDCYRPQRAVDHFVRWAEDIGDRKTQKEFYPTVDKRHLFRDGYIAKQSGHSRASTVDLTIVPLPPPAQERYSPGQPLKACFGPAGQRFRDNSLDMGTGFDCFHERSHTVNGTIGITQRKNRLLLKALMDKHGFTNYDKEWWHYTLRNEPYPDTYFDFPVE